MGRFVWLVRWCLCCCVVVLVGCSQSEPEGIDISQLFIREIPPGQTSVAAYMVLKNNTRVTQKLNYIHSPIAENVELHRNFYIDGMMQMRPVKRLSVNPGDELVLSPGGFHLMLFGVYEEMPVGSEFEITLEFETGIVITKNVQVRPFG